MRGVKQREYAEQQLRVEAEERSERLQREMRGQIQELAIAWRRPNATCASSSTELSQLRERDARLTPIVRELMDVAAGLRAGFERELTALREELQQQVVWERETYVRELTAMGARMEDLRFELTRTADDLRAQLSAEPTRPGAAAAHDRARVRARGRPPPRDGRRARSRRRTSARPRRRGQGGGGRGGAAAAHGGGRGAFGGRAGVVAQPSRWWSRSPRRSRSPRQSRKSPVEEPVVAEEPEAASETAPLSSSPRRSSLSLSSSPRLWRAK